jgi:hypothetical protein
LPVNATKPDRAWRALSAFLILAFAAALPAAADDSRVLRIISWASYVPSDVIAQFKKETGIDVQVTLSNNEEMISKLRATGGAGFDLAQPSQDRIFGAQQEFRIYKPLDTSKVMLDEFVPELVDAVRKNATVDGKLYGLPYVWGTEGLIYNSTRTKIADYTDLCKPELKGRTAVRLKRPGVRARLGSRSIRALLRHQGVHGPHAAGRQDPRRLQGEFPLLLRQQGPAAERSALGRDLGGDDVGLGWVAAESRESGHQVHQSALGRDRLDGHVCTPRPWPQRRWRLRLDQLRDAPRGRRAGGEVDRQFHRLQGRG